MEIKNLLENNEIIGIVGTYQISEIKEIYVKDLPIKNINDALKMVNLDTSIISKKISELTLSELFKIDLMLKLSNNIIIVGNLSKMLNYKDIEYIKKLLLKLNNDYQKKIVIIDEDINVFMNITNIIYVMKNREIIYKTSDFYDDKLYEYVKMPKIIEFVKFVQLQHELDNHLDIYELIKDIYRRVS